MGQLLGLGLGLLGAGIGAGQKTGGETTEAKRTGTSTTMPIEPGYFSDFRQSLVGPYQDYLKRAGQPVYGDAQKAQFLNQTNETTNASLKNLASQVASRGGSLNSGAYASGATNLLMNRNSDISKYNASVPMLNQQAFMTNMGAALGLGTGWAGKAPLGSTTNDSSTLNSTTNRTSGSFLNSLASMLGNSAGSRAGGGSGGAIASVGSSLLNHFFGDNSANTPDINSEMNANTYDMNDGYAQSLFNPASFDPSGMSGSDWAGWYGSPTGGSYNPLYPQTTYDPSSMSGLDWSNYFNNTSGFNPNSGDLYSVYAGMDPGNPDSQYWGLGSYFAGDGAK